ncbi:MAG: hypothetical protein LWW85_00760 [Marinilabiliales bacterium]|nr:hypothetical protein [Marinilabiliales bacterium]
MKSSTARLLFWFPRILCIAAILFVSLFALDSFEGNAPLSEKLLAFAIHLVPSYILTASLLIAWKWEKIGGILYILIALGFAPFLFNLNYHRNHFSLLACTLIVLTILGPFLLAGVGFLLSDRYGKRKS